MSTDPSPCTAFIGTSRVAAGSLADVARAVREVPEGAQLLVFADATGQVVDLDRRTDGAPAAQPASRGRPKLGVVAREVTLLPRHWDWLGAQPGGASVALRKLVETASRDADGAGRRRAAQQAAYRFATAMAGDAPGYEAAIRALYAGDRAGFDAATTAWPGDVRDHANRLADAAF